MPQLSASQLAAIPQELKEAVCNAVVEMTVARVTGRGVEGKILYGSSPRRSIVSGQLLPRFDQTNEDETSDVRIAAIGVDFQVDANTQTEASVMPRFCVYVRVLPTWAELNDSALDLFPEFKLRRQTQDVIDLRIRQLRNERYAAEGVATPNWQSLNPTQRQQVREKRTGIEAEVRRLAYAEQGIKLQKGDDQLLETTPPDTGSEDQQPTPPPTSDGNAARDDTTTRLRIGTMLQRGRSVPVGLLETAPIPPKWLRIDLTLPAFTWSLNAGPSALQPELDGYNAALRNATAVQIRTWLQSADGVQTAWRERRVSPADVASEAAWNTFCAQAAATPPSEPDLMPSLSGITVEIERTVDFLNPDRASIRVVLDNANSELGRRDLVHKLDTIFDTGLEVTLPAAVHRSLQLDRVEPSYRFRHFLDYPAIGLNCGVASERADAWLILRTTWSPRFVQPRITARELDGLPVSFKVLADETFDVAKLLEIPRAYTAWINAEEQRLKDAVRDGLAPEDADRESRRLEADINAQRGEAEYIRKGIQLLGEAQSAFRQSATETDTAGKAALLLRAAPYRAWLYMNRSFLRRDKRNAVAKWRLFQLAFILAHIPTFASRMREYRQYQDLRMDEMSASLLYFSTGGGKSEAFYGALLFSMFLDRLRGKHRGVTALVRYPLRLLTLQQGQRLLRLIAHAELQRLEEKVPGWPFEIGFWVGGNNTPNRYAQVPTGAIPTLDDRAHPDDTKFEEGVPGRSGDDEKDALAYREYRAAIDKIPACPICGKPTGLRRATADGATARRLAIICFDPKCPHNAAHGHIEPLPFLLTDDAIYDRAPSIVLGTIDKLAMLGQSTTTIRRVLGMFGLARGIGPTGHITAPRTEGNIEANLHEDGYAPVFPTFRGGQRVFFDPFPSLIIQDEAHLLEESLGTFSGLFDGLLEQSFREIFEMAGTDLDVARVWTGDGYAGPRMPKVIAATATISNPSRQLEVLYQREPLRFPSPGPDLYRSFFATPAPPPAENPQRVTLAEALPDYASPERTSPWMRLFVSVMTNDATHTVTAVAILASFHAIISHLWAALADPARRDGAVTELIAAQGRDEATDWRIAALERARNEGQWVALQALIDLHRIGLTYVTNKKGGDQVMDALDPAVEQHHRVSRESLGSFGSRLISGGIDMRTIQEIMEEAQTTNPGQAYPPLADQLRNIVATSAISHGVDVDRFNSMFFAGLPSDIAEYIQASSRVGRTHVGFVMLVPTPQSRRDRYVVETHDIFHRFLERMISPPAVERWAENAVRRVLASMVQVWAMLQESRLLLNASDADKARVELYETIVPVRTLIKNDNVGFLNALGTFVIQSIGMNGRGANALGRPVYHDLYRRLIEFEMTRLSESLRKMNNTLRFRDYWADTYAPFKPPMTSLRDVDEAGFIVAAAYDEKVTAGRARVDQDDLIKVMKAIRQQRGGVAETDTDQDGAAQGRSQ